MFSGGIPIGKAFGIQLRLHYSWFFIFALITFALAVGYFPSVYPDWSLALKISAGLITSILFFGSVLLHELMHSVVALHEGMEIKAITLFFLGGVSEMTSEPKTAMDEFRMAGAGPLSSLVLGGIFFGIYFLLGTQNSLPFQYVSAISYYLYWINIILGVFNLIPGFPLDGGRVFRSLVWFGTKNLQRATRIASNIGRGFGFLFILIGIFSVFFGPINLGFIQLDWLNGIFLALIGWFLESAASGSYRQLLLQDMLKGHTASEVMSQDCSIVRPEISVETLVNENILSSGRRCFPVVSDEQTEGLITLRDVKAVPKDEWSTTPVRRAMTPIEKVKFVGPNDDLFTVFNTMTQNDINQIPVVYEKRVIGIIGRDNIINFINTRTELAKR
jgi:Zn-dependent protease/CBS domain-containing protein